MYVGQPHGFLHQINDVVEIPKNVQMYQVRQANCGTFLAWHLLGDLLTACATPATMLELLHAYCICSHVCVKPPADKSWCNQWHHIWLGCASLAFCCSSCKSCVLS